ncbi:MAG: hypothetical protein QOF78_393 [Phycisphaerales bacterium]|nr:hypothetical protein [Phycisphaerales bacterium]
MVLAASVAALLAAPRYSKPVAIADVGTAAPDFQLEDVDGRTFTLSQHRGQAVVLFFGSVNCPRTADYNGRVARLARTYEKDSRVKFLALDVNSHGESIDRRLLRLDPKIADRGFPTLVDDKGAIANRYSATESPTFVVLDPHGVVRYRGAFDNSPDVAFVTHAFCAEALGDVLGSPTSTVAGMIQH